MSGRVVQTTAELPCTEAVAWAVLADLPAWPTWNPAVASLDGELALGARLRLGLRQGDRTVTVGVRITSEAQLRYLRLGLEQPGGKLPLFDRSGQEIKPATIRSCIEKGWAEPWFANPIKPDWLVCKLTDRGRAVLDGAR